jgi:hypothetical protein
MTDDPTEGLPEEVKDSKITTQMGVAAIALNIAMRYHDTNVVKDGALYQQYKLEGKNLQPLMLDHVLETAIKIEKHLLESHSRMALMLIESVAGDVMDVIEESKSEKESSEAVHTGRTEDES